MKRTIVHWINRFGQHRQHTLFDASKSYARNWWRENIQDCQGVLSVDERRTSHLRLVSVSLEEDGMKPVYRYYGLKLSRSLNLPAQTIWRTDGQTVEWTVSDYTCPWNEVSPDCRVQTPADLLNTEIFVEIFS
jgi:hypothetical protein